MDSNTPMSEDSEEEKKVKVKREPKEKVIKPSKAELSKLLKQALKIHIKEKSISSSTDELEAMVATCEEFMSSFIILGYDMNGEYVEPIVIAHSQQEADSLGAYLNKFINSQMGK